MPNNRLLGCAEENRMSTWRQQFRNELDGIVHLSVRQSVLGIAPGVCQLPKALQRVREDKLDSLVGNQCAGLKTACRYQVTVFGTVQ